MSQIYRCPNPECEDFGPEDVAWFRENKPNEPWICDQCLQHELVPLEESPSIDSAKDAVQPTPTDVSSSPPAVACDSSSAAADVEGSEATGNRAEFVKPEPTTGIASFVVGIKGPRSLDPSGNLVITATIACSSRITSGRVWLEERDSNLRGTSNEFAFQQSDNSAAWSQNHHLKIAIAEAGSTALSLIIENDEDPNYCWRGDFAIQAEPTSNQPINIDLSENISAGGDHFGGISERNVTIPEELAKHLSRVGDFQEFRVFRCSQKQLIPIHRQAKHLNRQLTLANFDPTSGTNRFWVLLGGREASFGRSKKPDANDVVLKPQDGSINSPISRKHFLVKTTEEGPRLQFFTTKNGSTLIRDQDRPEYIPLNEEEISVPIVLGQSSVSKVYPGAELNMIPNSFNLSYYPINQPDWVFQYQHMAEAFGLDQGMSSGAVQPHGFEITRNDPVPESYFLFDKAILMGSHPATSIRHPDLELRHARILFLDGSLWIEKHTPEATLAVNQRELRLNELHVLCPGDMIRAGKVEFEVSSKMQHWINCNCCR